MSGFRLSPERKIRSALCSPVSGDENPPKPARTWEMPLAKGLLMAVAFGRSTFGRAASGRRTGAVVCGLVALLVAAAGCGGGGEAQQSGGRGGGTGVGGMGGTMIMVDGGNPEKPLKQIGETCGTASDCGS